MPGTGVTAMRPTVLNWRVGIEGVVSSDKIIYTSRCPTELSEMMEMFCICAAQHDSHKAHVTSEA